MVKNLPTNTGDLRDAGSVPGWGGPPGEGNGYPLQYSCVENPHGQRSLAGYSPWGGKESDMTGQLSLSLVKEGKENSCMKHVSVPLKLMFG